MVIPVHDINPTRRTAWVTYALILANVVVFLCEPVVSTSLSGNPTSLADACHLQAFLQQWAAVPRELIHNQLPALVPTGQVGVSNSGATGCVISYPSYTKIPVLSVFSSMFLHGSWWHLLGNMLFLWVFGNNVEDRLGHLRYLLFYLVAGLVAGYGFAAVQPDSTQTLIGASGAIAGVLGAYLVLWPKARVWSLIPIPFVIPFIPVRLPAWLVLGLWFVLQALYSAGYGAQGGTVAYVAHIFGFVLGALVAIPLRPGTAPPPPAHYHPRYRYE